MVSIQRALSEVYLRGLAFKQKIWGTDRADFIGDMSFAQVQLQFIWKKYI